MISYADLCIPGVSICHHIIAFPSKATADELWQAHMQRGYPVAREDQLQKQAALRPSVLCMLQREDGGGHF